MPATITAKLISKPHSETKTFQYWLDLLINNNFFIFISPLSPLHYGEYYHAFINFHGGKMLH
jgi:hypothetical protein